MLLAALRTYPPPWPRQAITSLVAEATYWGLPQADVDRTSHLRYVRAGFWVSFSNRGGRQTLINEKIWKQHFPLGCMAKGWGESR